VVRETTDGDGDSLATDLESMVRRVRQSPLRVIHADHGPGAGRSLAADAEVPHGRAPKAAIGEVTQNRETMALVSWRFAGATSIARGMPYF
jgi:hypothetical protein